MKLNKKSIRASLFYLVLLLMVPFLLTIFFTARHQKNQATEFASDNAIRIARNLAEQQNFIETQTRQFLTVLSKLPEIKANDTSVIRPLFASLLMQNPIYATLLLCDTNGNVLVSGIHHTKVNVSDRKYFKDVRSSMAFSVGEYTNGRLSGKPVLHFATPVFNSKQQMVSVLVVSFDLSYYDKIYKNSNLGEGSEFSFVDHKGIMLYHSPTTQTDIGMERNQSIFKGLQGGDDHKTFWSEGADGIKRLYSFQRIGFKGESPYMYIYVGIPESVAYARYYHSLWSYWFVWIIAIGFIFLVSYWYSYKYIISPIDKLVKTAETISEGKLDERTGVTDHSTELGKLAYAIDDMTEKLMFREVEQKCSQKEMRKMKERFELALNSAHIGIWDWHIRKDNLVWDKNMFELYGAKSETFGGIFANWKECIHPDDVYYFEAEVLNAIEYYQPFRSEFRIIHPNQGIKYIRVFANVINDKQGKPVRLIGVNWDISERKILERKLSDAKHKAEESDKLKSTFLANISHELRTPLHGITGFAQILKDNEVSANERAQYLDIIVNSGNKLMTTVSNIIDISTIDSGKLKLMESEFNIMTSLSEIFQHYESIRKKEKKTFGFINEFDIDTKMSIVTDPFRLNQVYSNLLDNAFKFTESGTVIMGCKVDDDDLYCYVKDSGIGIASENIQSIFDRFKPENNEQGAQYSGNGLGLGICKGLIELMKGRIWAVKHPDGTEIIFTIPIVGVGQEYIEFKNNSLFA